MRKSFWKPVVAFTCALFTTLTLTAAPSFAKNYDDEVQTWQLLSRHWDEDELKERFTTFLKDIQEHKGIEDFIAPDISEEEKENIRNFFRTFEGKKDLR